jgi:hypothetical protein
MTEHYCHRPGCGAVVPPKMLACSRDWFALPPEIRSRIWQTYRRGQEQDKRPSQDYLYAASEAVAYWFELDAREGQR